MSEELQPSGAQEFADLRSDITRLLEEARRQAARSINAIMTATYWEIGRRIVEFEQGGAERARYGEHLIEHLAKDLTARFGRGFSERNLQQMRLFSITWAIPQTLSAESPTLPTPNASDYLPFCPPPSHSPGRTMCACSPFGTNMRAASMRRRRCAAAGRCDNWTDRSTRCSTSAQPSRRTRLPCSR